METYKELLSKHVEGIFKGYAEPGLHICDIATGGGKSYTIDKLTCKYYPGKTFIYQCHLDGEWLTKNDLSDKISADLKKRGSKFLGSTLIYSYLQSVGIINTHAPECRMFEKIGGTIVK